MRVSPYFLLFLLGISMIPCPASTQFIRKSPSPTPTTSDSARSDYYYAVSFQYWQKNADSVLRYANLSLIAARRAGYALGEAKALLSEGVGFILKEENTKGLDCYLQALRISERLQTTELTCNLYNDVGTVYSGMEDYNSSNHYYGLALRMALAAGDLHTKSILLTNIADNFKNLGQCDSALLYNSQALPIAAASHDSVLMAAIMLNTGEDYCEKGEFPPALACFRHCQDIAIQIHDEEDIAWALVSMADVSLRRRQYRQSITLAAKALEKGRRFSFSEIVRKSCAILCSGYQGIKRYDLALAWRNQEVALKDSLYSIEKDKKIGQLQSEYDLEKKQYQIDHLNQENLIREKEVQTERQRHFVFAGGALFFSLWAIFLFRGNREMDRLNRQLRSQKGS